jgi:dolichol kinase
LSATVIEGISPKGIDNLTVPLLTALILFITALIIYPPMLTMILIP